MSEIIIDTLKFSSEDKSFLKGVGLIELQLYDHAIEKFRSVLSKDPNNSHGHRMLALALAGEGRFEAAEHEARMALSMAPDDPESFHALGMILGEVGKVDEAEEVFQKAVEKNPQDSDFLNSLAQIKNMKGDYAGAEELSLKSMELSAIINPWALGNLANSYLNQKKYDEAMKIYLEILKDDPENPSLRNNVGVIYLWKNKPHEALVHFRAALTYDPTMIVAKDNIVNAIKARNFFYGWFWQCMLFFNKFSYKGQAMIYVGLPFTISVLAIYSKHSGKYAEFVIPLMMIYILFAISTWVVPPFFNKLVASRWIK